MAKKNNSNTNTNPIHVKLDYQEALQSKKELLSSEINFLKIASSIKRYSILRMEELKIKNKLHGKIRELKIISIKLNESFPKIKISREEKKEEAEEKEFEIDKKYFKSDLEFELEEIQRKLMELEERNQ
jgi:hypothetical protein